jgi:hypothetical protein
VSSFLKRALTLAPASLTPTFCHDALGADRTARAPTRTAGPSSFCGDFDLTRLGGAYASECFAVRGI